MSHPVTSDVPVHELIVARWSPYSFSEKPVSDDDLRALFEAARWAPSSYNEQPWRFIIAQKRDSEAFERALGCLVEGNQGWAQHAPVLVLAAARTTFERNGKPNRAAIHDLGLAAGNLCLEATARGIQVHQMIGIVPGKVREEYAVPEEFEPITALAIGYAGENPSLPDDVGKRDDQRRLRKPVEDFVFDGGWGRTANFSGD